MKRLIAILAILALPALALAGENHSSSSSASSQAVASSNQQAIATGYGAGGSSTSALTASVPHQAPSVFGGYVAPTAPCESAGFGGASWLTGALTFGITHRNKWCQKLELSRALYEQHHPRGAVHILCTTKAARKAKLEICRQFKASRKR